jgi:hypothetical protein
MQHRTDSFERDQIVEALQRAGGVKIGVKIKVARSSGSPARPGQEDAAARAIGDHGESTLAVLGEP